MNKSRFYTLLTVAVMAVGAQAQTTPASQMEKLDRGLVAVRNGSSTFLSWRLLGTDDEDRTRFDILRNGSVLAKDLYATCYSASGGTDASIYQVVTKVNGEAVDTSIMVKPWTATYKALTLQRPSGGSTSSGAYTYSPNDMSVGDVDGDGQYELFVKWDPSNSKDNSQDGVTGNVIIDCYKVDWTFGANGDGGCQLLWRVDLGQNIRAGAHYTQYMVYDFNGDGKAEMICKTAPGSKDSKGNYVNQATTNETIKAANNTKSWITSSGRMNGGHEYLTVFSGLTGEAINTIAYNPNRNATSTLSEASGSFDWYVGPDNKHDQNGYNRGDRYLAAVAYLDGPNKPASGIFCRGYYSYAFIWAVDFDGQKLIPRWLSSHRSKTSYSLTTYDAEGQGSTQSFTGLKPTNGNNPGSDQNSVKNSATMFANGNHNLSVGDVDGDGCDEILWGSAGLNNDGTLLYGTGFGHGDAIHLADHCPDRPGLELFQIHEEGPYGWDLHDALTGEVLYSATGSEDNGRGICGQFDANVRGSLFWSSNDGSARSAVTGEAISTKHGTSNFRIFWNGDLHEELLDGNKIDKWNGNGTSRIYINGKDLYDQGGPSSTCNSTKNTPNLSADILGDWREEVILHNGADQIAIYTTITATDYRVPTLMHDHTYRMGVCWQNVAYNQPPHLGYYLPDAFQPCFAGEKELTVQAGEAINWTLQWRYAKSATVTASYDPDGKRKALQVPTGMSRVINTNDRTLVLTGALSQTGDYLIEIKLTGMGGETVTETLTIHVGGETAIKSVATEAQQQVYDLQGRSRSALRRGLNIVRDGNEVRKVIF